VKLFSKKYINYYFLLLAFLLLFAFPYSARKQHSLSLFQEWFNGVTKNGHHDDWKHCLLVPFILCFLIYKKRKEISDSSRLSSENKYGYLLLLIPFIIYIYGFLSNLHYLGFVSLQVLPAVLIVWHKNWEFFYKYSFYWWFLWFVWPFYFLGRMLGLPLRHLMTWMSEKILFLLQLDPVREGTAIFSAPNPSKGLLKGELYQVEVAVACSGLRSLFALMMISAIFGFLRTNKGKWQWFYFLSSIPLAVFGNCVRILLLVGATMLLGEEFAIGTHSETHGEEPSFFHLFAGYFVFIFNIIGLMLFNKFINRLEGKRL